ncbi:uncharacterized protein LOC105789263 isoform X3 [Gossypium raimondii]|nr:uncharacterized protein LOC105789263 isoform X3 [Gossypium raimondii]
MARTEKKNGKNSLISFIKRLNMFTEGEGCNKEKFSLKSFFFLVCKVHFPYFSLKEFMEANGSEQPKCQRSFNHRGRKNDCWDEVVKVLCMILRDDSISNIRLWKEKKVKIQEAFTQLEDMMSKNALQESCWTEVVKLLRIILGDESISTTANAICDQKAQSMTEAKTFCKVSGMLSNVLKSCCAKMYDIVDSANSIQGPFVQIEDEQFALHFPGSKMIDEEKQAEEMKFAIKYVGGRLETLTLKMQSDQKMIPPAHLNPESSNPMGALGDSFDIEELQTDSPLESWLDNLISTVVIKGYEVYQRNADALNKIFQNHAHFADQFQLKDRVFQSNIMNALAEIYLKLESSLGKLELTEIDDILVRVKDMEVTGLELSWLRETLENQTKIKRLEEAIQESILELAKLKKKQRLE